MMINRNTGLFLFSYPLPPRGFFAEKVRLAYYLTMRQNRINYCGWPWINEPQTFSKQPLITSKWNHRGRECWPTAATWGGSGNSGNTRHHLWASYSPKCPLEKRKPIFTQENKKQITVACGCVAAPGEQRVGADSEIQAAGTPYRDKEDTTVANNGPEGMKELLRAGGTQRCAGS